MVWCAVLPSVVPAVLPRVSLSRPPVSRIALVKPDKARNVENMILAAAQRGALQSKVRTHNPQVHTGCVPPGRTQHIPSNRLARARWVQPICSLCVCQTEDGWLLRAGHVGRHGLIQQRCGLTHSSWWFSPSVLLGGRGVGSAQRPAWVGSTGLT